jgi:hypothetical protein
MCPAHSSAIPVYFASSLVSFRSPAHGMAKKIKKIHNTKKLKNTEISHLVCPRRHTLLLHDAHVHVFDLPILHLAPKLAQVVGRQGALVGHGLH